MGEGDHEIVGTSSTNNVDYGYDEDSSMIPSEIQALSPSTTRLSPWPGRPPRRSGFQAVRTVSMQRAQDALNLELQQQQQEGANNNKQNQDHTWRQTSTNTTMTESAITVRDFAVHSIRRGTQEWQELVKPFVADMAFCSVVSRHFSRQKPLFRPYTCQAAVLFVDISGYSKIASALADRGAHALSTAVNSYLSRILRLVRQYGGDVVKFAGDAVLCVWHTASSHTSTNCLPFTSLDCDEDKANNNHRNNRNNNNRDSDEEYEEYALRQNCLAAALCATQLQKQAGAHAVEGTLHEFRIHAGLCCGTVESEIFEAPVHTNMQRLYHLVGGEALEEIGDLVDLAKAGQVCVSAGIVHHLAACAGVTAQYSALPNYEPKSDSESDDEDEKRHGNPQLLLDLTMEESTEQDLDIFLEDTMIDRLSRRDRAMEEEFIHPVVLDLLSHGGLSPTQIAQMRDLVVLFIAQTSHGSPANWLLEVQAILDRNQCPLLQVVADDKGVHAIAAVNAVASVPESRLMGLEICRQLVNQKMGVAIGMAAGSTFCGVTGSSSVACRWDITGGPPVRAARLMQYALAKNVPMAIDASVCVGSTVPARMTMLQDNVPIKGSPAPIQVYTLSEATEFAAMNLLETVHGEMHMDQVHAITKHITGKRHRSAVVVTGPTLSGKKIVCQQAAGFADMVPFLHTSDSSYGLLQLVRTIANWFKYVDDERVHDKAMVVLDLMDKGLFSLAHDQCLGLVDDAMESGFVACFIVDRVGFLDEFSISFIRECLHGRKYRQKEVESGPPKLGLHRPSLTDSISNISFNGESGGRIAFLCVHVPLYTSPSAESVAEDITRSHRNLSVPIIEVHEATLQQFRDMTYSMTGSRFDDRLLYIGSAAAGHCAGYFIERSAAITQMQPGRAARGEKVLVHVREDMTNCIPPGSLRDYRSVPVMKIGSEIAMRYGHSFDELPPIMQVFCKVLAVMSQTGFYWTPVQRVWEVLNDLLAEGVADHTLTILLKEMSTLYLIRVWEHEGRKYVKFQCPASADIALDVCTPVQVESIAKAWIDRLGKDKSDFRVLLVLAWLYVMTDPCKKCKRSLATSVKLWQEGYHAMLSVSEAETWDTSKINRWKELIASEIEAGGSDPFDVLGADFSYEAPVEKTVSFEFVRVWMYRGPIGLGPLGNTISVLAERIKQELLSTCFDSSFCTGNTQLLQRQHIVSAVKRYIKEVEIVENMLMEHGFGTDPADLEEERRHVETLAIPAKSADDVYEKGRTLIDAIVSRFVQDRLHRLRSLTRQLDGAPLPEFVEKCTCIAIRKAYLIMFQRWVCMTEANEVDCAQHALMILATRNWQPRPTPEPMRHLLRQSVARLRNAVVRRLNDGQLHFAGHQQSSVDLKAFLLTTALLFDAQDTQRYQV